MEEKREIGRVKFSEGGFFSYSFGDSFCDDERFEGDAFEDAEGFFHRFTFAEENADLSCSAAVDCDIEVAYTDVKAVICSAEVSYELMHLLCGLEKGGGLRIIVKFVGLSSHFINATDSEGDGEGVAVFEGDGGFDATHIGGGDDVIIIGSHDVFDLF